LPAWFRLRLVNRNRSTAEACRADYASSLEPLGNPKSFEQSGAGLRGGFSERFYRIVFEGKTLTLITRADSAGKLEQYQISE